MSELAWDDTDVTMVKPRGSTVEPPDLPTLPPPRMDAPDLAVTDVRDDRPSESPASATRAKARDEDEPVWPQPPAPMNEAKIGILPPRRFVSQLAITEVEGDERDTWTFIKATMAIPMVRATQALPLVRVRRRRLIKALPWLAMLTGAISGVVLCWWLTLPKAPAVAAALAPAHAAVVQAGSQSVSGLFVDGPVGVRVEIDGFERGTLPLRVEGLSPGEHHLRFDGRPDHGVLERDVTLKGGEVNELEPVSL